MAPCIPAEIDLFTVPHSRMKELVNTYTQKVQCVDFRDCQETINLLKELHSTLYEFKSHECIENLFIMDQLKNRLKQRHIYNSAVCNCHNDTRLSEMLELVRDGKHFGKRSIGERLNFGEELQKCFSEFVQQFLPHMEEEENIFQPLMVEHFEYDELRVMKEVVLEQHELIKDPQYQEKSELDLPEVDAAIKEFRDIDPDRWCLADLFNETPDQEDKNLECWTPWPEFETERNLLETDYALNETDADNHLNYSDFTNESVALDVLNKSEHRSLVLPSEILFKIFRLLTPPDRGRCAHVCTLWNELVYSSTFWKEIYPIQWARGIWAWSDANLNFVMEDEVLKKDASACDSKESWKYDEDADVDESEESNVDHMAQREYVMFASIISHLLPKIGRKVEKLVLDAGRGITSRQMRQALILCPNVTHFSAAYSCFDYHTLKGVSTQRCLKKLTHFDVQGCVNVDDNCLFLLAECQSLVTKPRRRCSVRICMENSRLQQTHTVMNSNENSCFCCVVSSSSAMKPSLFYATYDNAATSIRGCPFFEAQSNPSNISTTDSSGTDGELDIEELHSVRRRRNPTKFPLEYLNFSGCYEVTERGLLYLLNEGLLQQLSYLNVSSCFNISGIALQNIVRQCRKLHPENLSYCNGIINGPYPSLANGCDNMYHPIKVCCQARLDL